MTAIRLIACRVYGRVLLLLAPSATPHNLNRPSPPSSPKATSHSPTSPSELQPPSPQPSPPSTHLVPAQTDARDAVGRRLQETESSSDIQSITQNKRKVRDQHSGTELDKRNNNTDQLQHPLNSQCTRSMSPPYPTSHHQSLASKPRVSMHRHSARCSRTSRTATPPVAPARHNTAKACARGHI